MTSESSLPRTVTALDRSLPAVAPHSRRWNPLSLALILLSWLVLQLGGIFRPGLLDDVDSVYIQIAREMLARHDFVTPTIDGIRFFDKPPLMYWLAAGSMRVFGIHDWAARLPLTLGTLALLLATYALGLRFFVPRAQAFSDAKPAAPADRGALYAALALATCIGLYLYTRFFIPDILIALWMTLGVHCFLLALDRAQTRAAAPPSASTTQSSALLPALGFGVTLGLNLLTKGLIGVIFPVAFVFLYLALTGQLRLLRHLHLPAATAIFAAVAAPWHILAALRNPPIAMPPGLGLPARAGWSWFYLYNEHIARALSRRIPHDYGNVPRPLFWLLLVLWLAPWAAFLPAAFLEALRTLGLLRPRAMTPARFDSDADFDPESLRELQHHAAFPPSAAPSRFRLPSATTAQQGALTTLLWTAIVLGFFTVAARQEYYHLPALPALALLVGGFLASAESRASRGRNSYETGAVERAVRRSSLFGLVPLATLLAAVCAWFAFTAPRPPADADITSLLSSNPDLYNLSLGHIFDLTGRAMGYFRGPLLLTALGMLALGPGSHLMRRRRRAFAANLVLAAGMTAVLLAAHEGLARFYPTLGSRDLALAINRAHQPGDIVAIDGELTSGSTLLFYTGQSVLLVNGPWFGSFWPDAPHVFLDDAGLEQLWMGPRRVFLLTYHPDQRTPQLSALAPTHALASAGGKTVLTNR